MIWGLGGGLGEALSFKVVRDGEKTLQTPIQGVVYVGLVMISSEPYYGCVDVNLKGTGMDNCTAVYGHRLEPCST